MPDRFPDWVAYEPELLPSLSRMAEEGIPVLEEWFRWGEEWSMLLRIYGKLGRRSRIFEIGCGQGRIAFPLRYLLSAEGGYTGFDIDRRKLQFLRSVFPLKHSNFRFELADLRNSFYNPGGRTSPTEYRFPVDDQSQDLVFAASVFTHMLPDNVLHYFREAARALRSGGRCVFSFFLLDYYDPERSRPHPFDAARFSLDHPHAGYGDELAVVEPAVPERMTGYRSSLVARMAAEAGLRFVEDPVPGIWSGAFDNGILAQDLVILSTL